MVTHRLQVVKRNLRPSILLPSPAVSRVLGAGHFALPVPLPSASDLGPPDNGQSMRFAAGPSTGAHRSGTDGPRTVPRMLPQAAPQAHVRIFLREWLSRYGWTWNQASWGVSGVCGEVRTGAVRPNMTICRRQALPGRRPARYSGSVRSRIAPLSGTGTSPHGGLFSGLRTTTRRPLTRLPRTDSLHTQEGSLYQRRTPSCTRPPSVPALGSLSA